MQILQNLTLITITKNRPESLLHMLKYYDGSGVTGPTTLREIYRYPDPIR